MSHSVYAFSSSDRWLNCAASIRMSKGMPNKTNEAAERGTATHQLGEFCIAIGVMPKLCIGLVFNGFTVDSEMVRGAELYVMVAKSLSLKYGVQPLLEQRVTMSSLGRTDVFGTSDMTFIVLNQGTLHTLDYKNGRGVVEVDDNSQTAGYSVATLDTFKLWDKVNRVINTIIQPNYDHIQGPVRTIEYSIEDMQDWQRKFALGVMTADDPNSKPVAGEWCHYCPASAHCRARMERTLKMAYTDSPIDVISVGELEVIYSEIGSVKRFLEAVEERVLDEARNGVNFNQYKLVEAYSRATCTDVNGLLEVARQSGIDPLKLYLEPRLVGKTKAAELLPKEVVNKFYRTPPVSSTVVPLSDKRPALRVGKASGIFQPIQAEEFKSAAGIFQPIV